MYLKYRIKALKNIFFRIENAEEWDAVYDVLLTIESLEELRLLFSLETPSNLVDHIPRRALRDGRIQTQISRLIIADNVSYNEAAQPYYPFHECCFDILACFPNVEIYDLNTSYPIVPPTVAAKKSVARWKKNHNPSASLVMNVKWYETIWML